MLQITPETLAYLRKFQQRAASRARITLAYHPLAKPRQLSVRKFKVTVEEYAQILLAGEPTKFRHEGTCRYALRVSLIAIGWNWADADREAIRVIGAALKVIGAERPTWMKGQPEYRQHELTSWRYRHCVACGGMLDDDQKGRHCSSECASITAKKTWARENKERMNALTNAWAKSNPEKRKVIVARSIERADPRECKMCGSTFRIPNSKKGEFCKPDCAYAFRKLVTAKKNEKQCSYCLGIFSGRTRDRKKYYCSKTCGFAAKRAGAATIFKCEAIV